MSTAAASIIHVAVDETYKSSAEGDVLDVIKDQLAGLIVFDRTFEPIFCTREALLLMKAKENKDVAKIKLGKNKWTIRTKTFKQVVG